MARIVPKSEVKNLLRTINQDLFLKPKSYQGDIEQFPAYRLEPDGTLRLPFWYGWGIYPQSGDSRETIPVSEDLSSSLYSLSVDTPDNPRTSTCVRGFEFREQLRSHQEPIVDEAYDMINENYCSQLNLYCGAGKTVMAIKIASMFSHHGHCIVVVPLVALLSQWEKSFEKYTNARKYVDYYITMVGSLKDLPTEVLETPSLLILDEAHLLCTKKRLDSLLSVVPQAVLALTATPKKDNGLHKIMDLLAGPDKIKMISERPFRIYCFKTGLTSPRYQNQKGDTDWVKTQNWFLNQKQRDQQIINWVSSNLHKKICILTSRIDHVNRILDLLSEAEIENVEWLAGTKSTYKNCNVLVGTVQKMGTGFDESAACEDFDGNTINMLILVAGGKQIEQSVGRSFRSTNPTIVHFVDSSPICLRHWAICQRWYSSRKGQIIETTDIIKVSDE